MYTNFTLAGAAVLLLYLIWLSRAAEAPKNAFESLEIPSRHTLANLLRPFRDRNFRWLLAYGLIFAFFTQFDQVFQRTLPKNLLGIEGAYQLGAITLIGIRLGQTFCARFVGKWIDLRGTVHVMTISQCLSAFGILVYFAAFFWNGLILYLSIFFWVCYVGLNVALPKIQLETATDSDRASVVAAYGAATGLMGTLGILLGGYLYGFVASFGWLTPAVFLLSFSGRCLSAGVLYVWARRSRR